MWKAFKLKLCWSLQLYTFLSLSSFSLASFSSFFRLSSLNSLLLRWARWARCFSNSDCSSPSSSSSDPALSPSALGMKVDCWPDCRNNGGGKTNSASHLWTLVAITFRKQPQSHANLTHCTFCLVCVYFSLTCLLCVQ